MTPKHALALLALLAAAGCQRTPGEKPAQAAAAKKPRAPEGVSIRVAAIGTRTVERSVEISGSLASPEDATIAAEVEGKVLSVRADLGDRVKKGQVLAVINAREYRLAVEQAEARRVQAEADLKRISQLAKNEMVAPQQLDDVRSRATQSRAAAELARKKYQDTSVRAPFDGAVAKRSVSLGEYVRPGQAVFQVVVLDPLKLTGEVPERFLAQVKQGITVSAQVDAYPDRSFKGTISRVSPAVDPKSRSFTVEAQLANGDGALKPGLFARARIDLGATENALVVPESAVATFAGNSRVYVVEEAQGKTLVREKLVTVERRLPDGHVIISGAGLQAGQRVAVAGLARLADQVQVRITTPRAAAKAVEPGSK